MPARLEGIRGDGGAGVAGLPLHRIRELGRPLFKPAPCPRARRLRQKPPRLLFYCKSFSRSCPSTSALRTSCSAVARSFPFDSSACWMNVLIRSTVSLCVGLSDLPDDCCSADRARARLCAYSASYWRRSASERISPSWRRRRRAALAAAPPAGGGGGGWPESSSFSARAAGVASFGAQAG